MRCAPAWAPLLAIACRPERPGLFRFGGSFSTRLLLPPWLALAGRAMKIVSEWSVSSEHRRRFRPRILAVKCRSWDSTQGGRGSRRSAGLSA